MRIRNNEDWRAQRHIHYRYTCTYVHERTGMGRGKHVTTKNPNATGMVLLILFNFSATQCCGSEYLSMSPNSASSAAEALQQDPKKHKNAQRCWPVGVKPHRHHDQKVEASTRVAQHRSFRNWPVRNENVRTSSAEALHCGQLLQKPSNA